MSKSLSFAKCEDCRNEFGGECWRLVYESDSSTEIMQCDEERKNHRLGHCGPEANYFDRR